MASQKAKIAAAAVLLTVAGIYAYQSYTRLQPSPAINNGATGEGPGRGGTPQQREAMMKEMAAAVGITPEQQKQLDAIREKAMAEGNPMAMMTSGAAVLTPEQREKTRDFFRQQMEKRDAKAKASMSAEEYDRYREKRREMFSRWGGPGGAGRPGGANAPAATPASAPAR